MTNDHGADPDEDEPEEPDFWNEISGLPFELRQPPAGAVSVIDNCSGDPIVVVKLRSSTPKWLLTRVSRSDQVRLESGWLSLADSLKAPRDGFAYLCEGEHPHFTNVRMISASRIDLTAVPPIDGPLTTVEGFQDVLLSGWGQNELAEYPRKFLQTYYFASLLGLRGDPRHFNVSLHLTSGWVFNALYNLMRRVLPEKPDVAEIAFSSPGFVRFKVSDLAADDLRNLVIAYRNNQAVVRADVATLVEWSNQNRDELTDAAGKAVLYRVGEVLGFQVRELLARTDSPKHAAKITSSLVRRLSYLSKRHDNQEAILVGLPPVLDERT